MSFRDKNELEEQNEKVAQQLKDNPELAAKINPLRDMVQAEMDLANGQYFSNEALEREAQLRKWIRDMFDDKSLNVSDAEEFIMFIKKFRADNGMKDKGQAAYFVYNKKIITITILGHVHVLPKYVGILEKQLASHERNLQLLYNNTFWGYIKLAFKKLFGGTIGQK